MTRAKIVETLLLRHVVIDPMRKRPVIPQEKFQSLFIEIIKLLEVTEETTRIKDTLERAQKLLATMKTTAAQVDELGKEIDEHLLEKPKPGVVPN